MSRIACDWRTIARESSAGMNPTVITPGFAVPWAPATPANATIAPAASHFTALFIDPPLRNDCRAQHLAVRRVLHSLAHFLQLVLAIHELMKRKTLAIGVNEIERLDQVTRVIVVHAADGEELAQDLVRVDAHERIGIHQAAEHVASAGAQVLDARGNDFRIAAQLDDDVRALRAAQLAQLGRVDLVEDRV